MKFKDAIINDIINPSMNTRLTNAIGVITSYNPVHNIADVYVNSLADGDGIKLREVPIQIPGGGIHSSPVAKGDKVYIQFNNGSVFQPKIIGVADERYSLNTRKREKHLRKGSLLQSLTVKDGEVKPSNERWLDLDNENLYKFHEFRKSNPVKDASSLMHNKGYFKKYEIGLYNPVSSAVVKLQDNGAIDIFTSTNVGFRVNPRNRTIEMFGDVSTKSDKWTVLSNNIELHANENISISGNNLDISVNKLTINGEEKNV